jgi:hypothetical protein
VRWRLQGGTKLDFDKLKSRLDKHGIIYLALTVTSREPMYFKDPDGIQIELTNDPLYETHGGRLGRD